MDRRGLNYEWEAIDPAIMKEELMPEWERIITTEISSSREAGKMLPPVLDATCGSKTMWFDKNDKRCLYIDNRKGEYPVTRYSRPNTGPTTVAPDKVIDFTDMPFPDGVFHHIVFDPPHLSKLGDTSTFAKVYGKLLPDWRDMLKQGFSECFRVLRCGGTLIFKWCEFEIPLSEVLKLTTEKPLYGHRTGRREKTHWLAFLKALA